MLATLVENRASDAGGKRDNEGCKRAESFYFGAANRNSRDMAPLFSLFFFFFFENAPTPRRLRYQRLHWSSTRRMSTESCIPAFSRTRERKESENKKKKRSAAYSPSVVVKKGKVIAFTPSLVLAEKTRLASTLNSSFPKH